MKIGIEQEFFVTNKAGEYIAPQDHGIMSIDECGFLAEIRTSPFSDVEHVLYDLKLKYEALVKTATKNGVFLQRIDKVQLPKKFYYKMLRRHGKGVQKDECMYGEVKFHNYQTAGVHVHFSPETEHSSPLNMPEIIRYLDGVFADEIKRSGRDKGMYEMKQWGFEYRSLPTSIDLIKLKKALKELQGYQDIQDIEEEDE